MLPASLWARHLHADTSTPNPYTPIHAHVGQELEQDEFASVPDDNGVEMEGVEMTDRTSTTTTTPSTAQGDGSKTNKRRVADVDHDDGDSGGDVDVDEAEI